MSSSSRCLSWGRVVGPALGWLILPVLAQSEGHAAGLMLTILAPIAPFLRMVQARARGDMTFAGACGLPGTVATAELMAVMASQMIKGLTLSVGSLAQPLTLPAVPLHVILGHLAVSPMLARQACATPDVPRMRSSCASRSAMRGCSRACAPSSARTVSRGGSC